MDGFEGYGEQDFEQDMDFADPEVTYVESNEDNVVYLKDPNVSDGTDFDLPQTLPQYPAEAFNDPESAAMQAEIKRLNEEYEAPTKTIGVTQDLITLSQNVASGDKRLAQDALESFSKTQLERFTSPKVVGPILLFWAWRGKLSWMERGVIAIVGAGAVMSAFKPKANNSQPSTAHPLSKNQNPYYNPLSGRY